MPRTKSIDTKVLPVARRVEGGPKLGAWLKKNGRSQLWLHRLTDIGQQLISAYVNQLARPQPMSPNSVLIEKATEGHVRSADWMTSEEIAHFRKANRFALPEAG